MIQLLISQADHVTIYECQMACRVEPLSSSRARSEPDQLGEPTGFGAG